jgi:peptidoglycan hydrolase-like protein with peptidoglycan-binding domain
VNRRVLLPLAAVALAAVAGGATWAVGGGSASGAAETDAASSARATATVQRRDLVQHESVSGTLGYADSESLYAHGAGTVTALRRPGRVVERGQALYWVDDNPVTLMYGSAPMWRRLDRSSPDGEDIRQLERNLVALGYDPSGDIEIDDDWDWATTAAVKRRQKDLGVQKTGAVELGQIAFLPGPRRIGQLKTTVGALLQPGAEVMDTSSTKRVATIDLDADKRSLVKRGDRVTVELPDGSTVAGRITSVGKVAESETDPQTGEESDPTVEVTIKLARGSKAGDLDEAPVDVQLAKETAKNALSVPVSALLALAEGGYAVEVLKADGSPRLVRVEPGMFADGLVQISGKGIAPGRKVVVPA